MRIPKSEYEAMQEANKALERECERLANLITEKTGDCKMGPWCKDCAHLGIDYSKVSWSSLLETHTDYYGRVQYCKKSLHQVCPDFERSDGHL